MRTAYYFPFPVQSTAISVGTHVFCNLRNAFLIYLWRLISGIFPVYCKVLLCTEN